MPKLTWEFVRITDHPYNVDAEVYSAKFGRTRVDIWIDKGPRKIWRGTPPVVVAELDETLWSIVVHGDLSSCALTKEVAMSEAERLAWGSQANRFAWRPVLRHAVSADVKHKHDEEFYARIAATMKEFPVDYVPLSQRPPAPSMGM